jgi:hypothetical protein
MPMGWARPPATCARCSRRGSAGWGVGLGRAPPDATALGSALSLAAGVTGSVAVGAGDALLQATIEADSATAASQAGLRRGAAITPRVRRRPAAGFLIGVAAQGTSATRIG